ncbi:MAG: hypothetical protein HWD61_03320 [Parachlamydiaceae bacterium]|nr:MAG: hypothetical protein HWD61_03320 [Parachlamydiaceae bacterium]
MMFNWIKQYREANPHTKYFILNWALYGLLIIASTLYVYGRLNYVRSTPSSEQQKKNETNSQK